MLMAETAENLQKLLDVVFCWCEKWRLSINEKKLKSCMLGSEMFHVLNSTLMLAKIMELKISLLPVINVLP